MCLSEDEIALMKAHCHELKEQFGSHACSHCGLDCTARTEDYHKVSFFTQNGTECATGQRDIRCNFCGGVLGAVETQRHDNPNFAEYRTCLKCGYQWAKEYWAWMARVQGVKVEA